MLQYIEGWCGSEWWCKKITLWSWPRSFWLCGLAPYSSQSEGYLSLVCWSVPSEKAWHINLAVGYGYSQIISLGLVSSKGLGVKCWFKIWYNLKLAVSEPLWHPVGCLFLLNFLQNLDTASRASLLVKEKATKQLASLSYLMSPYQSCHFAYAWYQSIFLLSLLLLCNIEYLHAYVSWFPISTCNTEYLHMWGGLLSPFVLADFSSCCRKF